MIAKWYENLPKESKDRMARATQATLKRWMELREEAKKEKAKR